MSERFARAALLAAPEAFGRDLEVPFHHVDAAGILFYARLFEWFHDVYVAFLADAGFPLPQQLREGTTIAPLTHAEADYLAPLRFGDRVRVALVQSDVTADRVRLGWRVTGPAGPAATGHTVHVFVDPKTFLRTPMPDGLREAFTGLRAALRAPVVADASDDEPSSRERANDVRQLLASDGLLDEIGQALRSQHDGENMLWLDLERAELVPLLTSSVSERGARDQMPDWEREQLERWDSIQADDSGRWLQVPVSLTGQGRLREFVRWIPDSDLSEEVAEAVRGGRGGYRRVRDLLERHGLEQLWFDFETERDRDDARDWLRSQGVLLAADTEDD